MTEREVKDPKNIYFMTAQDSPLWADLGVYDPDLLQEEHKTLVEQVRRVYSAAYPRPYFEPGPLAKYNKLLSDFGQIEDTIAGLYKQFNTLNNMGQITMSSLMEAGLKLAFIDNIKRRRSISISQGYGEGEEKIDDLQILNWAGEMVITINGICFKDFTDKTAISKAPEKFFEFMVEAQRHSHDRTHHLIAAENDFYPYNLYPNFTLYRIASLLPMVNQISALERNPFRKYPGQGSLQDIVHYWENSLIEGVTLTQSKVYEGLFDPNCPGYQEVIDTFNQYLTEGGRMSIVAMHHLGFQDLNRLINAYRKSKLLASGVNSAFYQNLSTSIKDIVELYGDSVKVVAAEDLNDIFTDETEVVSEPVPSMDSLRRSVDSINSKSKQTTYSPNPKLIDFVGIVAPDSVELTFNKNKPQAFTIKLTFINNFGETFEINLNYDTSRKANQPFDWNILENPEDLILVYNQFLVITSHILDPISKEVDQEYRIKVLNKSKTAVHTPYRLKKGLPREKKVEDDKTKVKDKPLSPIERLLSEYESEQKAQIKNTIIIPDESVSRELTSTLSHQDKQYVFEQVDRFNTNSVGRFKQLNARDPDGKPIFSLRVSTLTGNGARVLLRETNSGEGIRYFEIVDIGYRKDIYRRYKI